MLDEWTLFGGTVFLQQAPHQVTCFKFAETMSVSMCQGAGGTVPVDEIDNDYADKTPRTVS